MKPQFSIRQLLAVIVPLAVGLTAMTNPTPFWEGSVFAVTHCLLFTAIIAAIYRTKGARAFWLGFAVFGWGFYLLCTDVVFELHSTRHSQNVLPYWPNYGEEDPPLRAFTKSLVDILQLHRRIAPKTVGEKIQVQWGGPSSYYPSSVLEIKDNLYKIRYDSDPQGTYDEWVGTGRIKLLDLDRTYRIGEWLWTLLFALAGGLIARYLYATGREREP
jgi:hypothetical protein